MNLQNLAALLAIIEFAKKTWCEIDKRYGAQIRGVLCECIDNVIDFLTMIRSRLEPSEENDDSNNNGVTGGICNSVLYTC